MESKVGLSDGGARLFPPRVQDVVAHGAGDRLLHPIPCFGVQADNVRTARCLTAGHLHATCVRQEVGFLAPQVFAWSHAGRHERHVTRAQRVVNVLQNRPEPLGSQIGHPRRVLFGDREPVEHFVPERMVFALEDHGEETTHHPAQVIPACRANGVKRHETTKHSCNEWVVFSRNVVCKFLYFPRYNPSNRIPFVPNFSFTNLKITAGHEWFQLSDR